MDYSSAEVERILAAGPFKPNWRSLENYRIPIWYKDAKFGIFIHWGVYSVPAYKTEWYARFMYASGPADRGHDAYEHHIATHGPQNRFGYKDFIPKFRAEHFDPAAWARLFEEAGAKFVMPVAEHHDGFAMYDCSLSRWTATKMGPKRDVLGELAGAIRDRGMVFTCSSHRAEHWWFFDGGRAFDSDVNDPAFADLYGPAMSKEKMPDQAFLEDWLARTCEVVLKYEPQIMWFDWWIEVPAFEPYLKRFAAFYYNWAAARGVEVAINYKTQAFPPDAAVYDIERGQVSGVRPLFWQNDTSVAKDNWGYVSAPDYKETVTIIQDLVDAVSKNGALLLNIGPRPDGTIPEKEQEMLRTIGAWLKRNGKGIYNTRPWKFFGEGPTQVVEGGFSDTKRAPFTSSDIRFTASDNILYAFVLARPEDGQVRIEALATSKTQAPQTIRSISSMEGVPLQFTRDEKALSVRLDSSQTDDHVVAFAIET